jgi:hypothetical protein
MGRLVPPWAKASLIAFCVVGVALLASMRAASGLGHLHAVENVSDMSAATVAAACAETVGAIDDFWPAVNLLSVGRGVPLPDAQAWGQVPRLVGVVHDTCPAIETYAGVAPAPQRSVADGAAVDALANIRRQQNALMAANARLTSSWNELETVDAAALAGDARLQRAARALGAAREQQADVADAVAFLAPDRLEAFLGGNAPRAIVLTLVDDPPGTQAYAVLDQGRVAVTDVGPPTVAPSAIVSVNERGLRSLQGTLSHAQIAPGASNAQLLRALLVEFGGLPYADEQTVVATLKHAADDHDAWLWFDDPSLQAVVARHGWTLQ